MRDPPTPCPDSAPTPATGLGYAQLSVHCQERAEALTARASYYRRQLARLDLAAECEDWARTADLLAVAFDALPEVPPAELEDMRAQLVTRMHALDAACKRLLA